jgi:hypothetical protein
MAIHDGTFATAINCMDGRTQIPVIEWMKRKFGADFVDTITEPGPIKVLSENKPGHDVDSVKRRLDISVNKHFSKAVAIVGHHNCAGNPLAKDQQIKQIRESMDTVKAWGFGITVVGLWVDENWTVHEVGP